MDLQSLTVYLSQTLKLPFSLFLSLSLSLSFYLSISLSFSLLNWLSCSVLRWMSLVRYCETRKVALRHKLGVLSVDMVSALNFFISLMCVWFEKKTTVLFICKHKQVESIVFAVSIKFCDKLGLAILTFRSPGRDSSARAISYRSKCIILFIFFFKLLDVDNTDKVCSNDKLGSVHQNCKFHDPLGMIKIYTYKLTNCTNKLRNASTRVNNYIFITTLDKRWS